MSTLQLQAEAASSETGEAASLLEVRNLVKDFPGMRALDQVDLTVKRGEIHALLGENVLASGGWRRQPMSMSKSLGLAATYIVLSVPGLLISLLCIKHIKQYIKEIMRRD